MSIAISFLLLITSHSTLKTIQRLKINQYLLFSWIFCWGFAVDIAVHCNGLCFLSGTWEHLEVGGRCGM